VAKEVFTASEDTMVIGQVKSGREAEIRPKMLKALKTNSKGIL